MKPNYQDEERQNGHPPKIPPSIRAVTFRCYIDGSWKKGSHMWSGLGTRASRWYDGLAWITWRQADYFSPPYRGPRVDIGDAESITEKEIMYFIRHRLPRAHTDARKPRGLPMLPIRLITLTDLRKLFSKFELVYQPRERNVKADLLARNARKQNTIFNFIGISTPIYFGDANHIFI